MKPAEIQAFADTMISYGFKQETKVQFSRGFMTVRLENALSPEPPLVMFPPFLSVKIYDEGANKYIQINIDMDKVMFFKNEQG